MNRICVLWRNPSGQWYYWITEGGRQVVTNQAGTYDFDSTLAQAKSRFSFNSHEIDKDSHL